jgi:hypothetical protein
MKHIFHKAIACMVITIMTAPLFAQDIIVTIDAKKIEAKIIEVSKSEIKYKEQDNLDGPTFVLSTNEINSIIYKNGKIALYNQPAEATLSKQETKLEVRPEDNIATIILRSADTIKGELVEMTSQHIIYIKNGERITIPGSEIGTVTLPNGQVREYGVIRKKAPTISYISRSGNTYYYEGKPMRGASYERFLEKNCIEAYDQYRNGENIAAAGWTLLACGLGIDLGCTIGAMIGGAIQYNQNNVKYSPSPTLIALYIVSAGCEIACIPTLCVGYAKKHKSADIFNTQCANKTPQAYWSINASQNGLGIAYNF